MLDHDAGFWASLRSSDGECGLATESLLADALAPEDLDSSFTLQLYNVGFPMP